MTDMGKRLFALIDEYHRNAFQPTDHKLTAFLLANGVVVREKGEWMEMVDCVEDGYTGEYYEEIYYNCLNCDYATTENTPFCPNCGADMRKGENG